MRESTDRERNTELYEVLLFFTTVVQGLYCINSAYHNVVVEERCAGHEDVREAGILSAPDRTSLRRVAVKVATKRSSVHRVPQQPIAPDIL